MFKSRISPIEYDFQKFRVTGPWDHMVSVSAKKKNSCLCTFSFEKSQKKRLKTDHLKKNFSREEHSLVRSFKSKKSKQFPIIFQNAAFVP
jgi:hypothetical protein